MKLLITGGCGFLGSNLASDALARGDELVVFDNLYRNGSRMDFEVNVMGSHNLLEAVRQHAPDATVVYSSTNKVYGDLEQYTYVETDIGSHLLKQFSRTELKFGALFYREGEIMESAADIGALERLGWRPSFSLEQGLVLSIEAENDQMSDARTTA